MTDQQKHYLVIPHHCGKAGAVSYSIQNAKIIEGIVSVGVNKHGHPDDDIKTKIERFVPFIEMTKDRQDIKKDL